MAKARTAPVKVPATRAPSAPAAKGTKAPADKKVWDYIRKNGLQDKAKKN